MILIRKPKTDKQTEKQERYFKYLYPVMRLSTEWGKNVDFTDAINLPFK